MNAEQPRGFLYVPLRHGRALGYHLVAGTLQQWPAAVTQLRSRWPRATWVEDTEIEEFVGAPREMAADILPLLHVPDGLPRGDQVRLWSENVEALSACVDFHAATDGSGNQDGYGGWATTVRRSGPTDFENPLPTSAVRFAATYGYSVLRNELTAMLEAIRIVANMEAPRKAEHAENYRKPAVVWVTDRADLAAGLIRRVDGSPLNRRSSCKDLWAQFAYLSRHCQVLPLPIRRNTRADQALCDKLAGSARAALKAGTKKHRNLAQHNNITWTKTTPQKDPH